jgi:hypothetical protein
MAETSLMALGGGSATPKSFFLKKKTLYLKKKKKRERLYLALGDGQPPPMKVIK